MNCEVCGAQIGIEDKFCPSCGSPINNKAREEEVSAIASSIPSHDDFVAKNDGMTYHDEMTSDFISQEEVVEPINFDTYATNPIYANSSQGQNVPKHEIEHTYAQQPVPTPIPQPTPTPIPQPTYVSQYQVPQYQAVYQQAPTTNSDSQDQYKLWAELQKKNEIDKYNNFALASLILSFFFPLIGLILGIIALPNLKKDEPLAHRSQAVAGIVISVIYFVVLLPIAIASNLLLMMM